VQQADVTAATSSQPELIAKQHDDHAEAAPQPEAPASPLTDSGPMMESQSNSSGSPTSPSAEIVAMNHPVVTQSISSSSKSQYAWLMELLRRRILSLQAYPQQARPQGLEGVVVVKTTINSDGNLIDAVVTKSSGYSALDEDALKLMHRVCPVHLPQELGKSQIAVLVPIRYKLDRFE
jgi:protein TonB